MSIDSVALFIDFEYFVYGAENERMAPPAPARLMERAAEYGSVAAAKAFGQNDVLDRYRQELRAASIEAILCTSTGGANKKNVTDFYMLDSIYQTAYTQGHIHHYILVTGDGDFASVLAYLRYRLQKNTIVMAYADSVSPELKTEDHKFVELKRVAKETWPEEEQIKLIRFVHSGQSLGKLITLTSTARVYKSGGATEDERREQIARMIQNGVFEQRVEEHGGGPIRLLYLNYSHPLVQKALGDEPPAGATKTE